MTDALMPRLQARTEPVSQLVTVSVSTASGERYGVRGYLKANDASGAVLVDTPGKPLMLVRRGEDGGAVESESEVSSMFIPAGNIDLISF